MSVPKSITQILATADLEVHNITGIIKLYFREMPEPLIPFDLYNECIAAYKKESKKEQRQAIIDIINHIPESNRRVLKILSRHLNKVITSCFSAILITSGVQLLFKELDAREEHGYRIWPNSFTPHD